MKGGHGWLGISNPGVVVMTAWRQDLWWHNIARARGFMLLDVLAHELGHQHDRMASSNPRGDAPRGEPYAIAYAQRVQQEVWPEDARRFVL